MKSNMILFRSAMSYAYSKARGKLNQYEKMSTETAVYKFWSKIELVQNSNNIDVIS